MKNRLQTLWNQVSPEGGPCPQPEARSVRRRVDAALDQKPRAFHPWRALRLAAVCAAALALLTGAAAASGMLPLPEYNVLSAFFGRGENAPGSEGMVNAQPVSVSDENYTLTVTTSMSDGLMVYCTLLLEGKTPQAAACLRNGSPSFDLWIAPLAGADNPRYWKYALLSYDCWDYDSASNTWKINMRARSAIDADCLVSLRFEEMAEGLRLEFPAQPAPTVTLEIGREGPGQDHVWDNIVGSVTLERIALSPLSLRAEFTSPDDSPPIPALHFLWKDGSVSTGAQMGIRGGASGSRTGSGLWEMEGTWTLRAVQDLSQMEAVVFGGMAYPLDGGQPYEVDVSALPQREN